MSTKRHARPPAHPTTPAADTTPATPPPALTGEQYEAIEALIVGLRHRSFMIRHTLSRSNANTHGRGPHTTEFDGYVLAALEAFAIESEEACDQVLDHLRPYAWFSRTDSRTKSARFQDSPLGRAQKGGAR